MLCVFVVSAVPTFSLRGRDGWGSVPTREWPLCLDGRNGAGSRVSRWRVGSCESRRHCFTMRPSLLEVDLVLTIAGTRPQPCWLERRTSGSDSLEFFRELRRRAAEEAAPALARAHRSKRPSGSDVDRDDCLCIRAFVGSAAPGDEHVFDELGVVGNTDPGVTHALRSVHILPGLRVAPAPKSGRTVRRREG